MVSSFFEFGKKMLRSSNIWAINMQMHMPVKTNFSNRLPHQIMRIAENADVIRIFFVKMFKTHKYLCDNFHYNNIFVVCMFILILAR